MIRCFGAFKIIHVLDTDATQDCNTKCTYSTSLPSFTQNTVALNSVGPKLILGQCAEGFSPAIVLRQSYEIQCMAGGNAVCILGII